MSSAPGSERAALVPGAPQTLEVGKVARAHGIRGELKVSLHWAESDALQPGRRLVLIASDGTRRDLIVDSVRPAHRALLVKLEGIDDKDAADALRGSAIHVARTDLPPPGPDEYFLSDLIGVTVQAEGRTIGQVEEVRSHPTLDSIVIRTPDGRLLEQPLGEQWVERVDVASRQLWLFGLDGVID